VVLLDSKEVSATGTFALSPEWLQPYTGTVEFTEAVEGTIALEGPLSALNHEGDIDQTRIVVDGFHPLSINGSWSGTGGSGIALSASVHTPEGGNAALTAALEPESSGGDWSVRIDEASLNDPVHALVLEQPFLVRINTGTGLRIDAVSPFQLSSDQTRVGGEYLREKDLLTVNVTNLELGALQSWTTQPPMPINIDQLEVTISHLQPFLESSFYLLAIQSAGHPPSNEQQAALQPHPGTTH
jgi:hypothetical protein